VILHNLYRAGNGTTNQSANAQRDKSNNKTCASCATQSHFYNSLEFPRFLKSKGAGFVASQYINTKNGTTLGKLKKTDKGRIFQSAFKRCSNYGLAQYTISDDGLHPRDEI
jgi:hypothetical protein